MKLCTYKRTTPVGTFKRIGIFLNESTIIDFTTTWQKYFEIEGYYAPDIRALKTAPTSMAEFINQYQEAAIEMLYDTRDTYIELAKEGLLKTNDGAVLAFDLKDDKAVKLACPLDKIHCYRDFYTHEKHVAKGFEKRGEPIPEAWYQIPAYYKGATHSFIGPEETVLWPSYTKILDYELELGVIIGRDGKNIKARDAYKHIFGYTILNDISARDIQKKEMSIRLGPAKAKDFCSVMGPVIITSDEFEKDPDLKMSATINGQLWSEGRSSDSHYSWGEIIEHTAKDEWVLATDFMGSGTVGTGCGLEIDKWLKPGDVIELEVEKIGKLKNTIGIPNHKVD